MPLPFFAFLLLIFQNSPIEANYYGDLNLDGFPANFGGAALACSSLCCIYVEGRNAGGVVAGLRADLADTPSGVPGCAPTGTRSGVTGPRLSSVILARAGSPFLGDSK